MPKHYAFVHQYGQHVQDADGNDIGTCVVFDSKRERDYFVRVRQARISYSTTPGWVEAYPAKKAAGWSTVTIADFCREELAGD